MSSKNIKTSKSSSVSDSDHPNATEHTMDKSRIMTGYIHYTNSEELTKIFSVLNDFRKKYGLKYSNQENCGLVYFNLTGEHLEELYKVRPFKISKFQTVSEYRCNTFIADKITQQRDSFIRMNWNEDTQILTFISRTTTKSHINLVNRIFNDAKVTLKSHLYKILKNTKKRTDKKDNDSDDNESESESENQIGETEVDEEQDDKVEVVKEKKNSKNMKTNDDDNDNDDWIPADFKRKNKKEKYNPKDTNIKFTTKNRESKDTKENKKFREPGESKKFVKESNETIEAKVDETDKKEEKEVKKSVKSYSKIVKESIESNESGTNETIETVGAKPKVRGTRINKSA